MERKLTYIKREPKIMKKTKRKTEIACQESVVYIGSIQ